MKSLSTIYPNLKFDDAKLPEAINNVGVLAPNKFGVLF